MSIATPIEDHGSPTIVESSAEHTQDGDVNGGVRIAEDLPGLAEAGVLPFTTDMNDAQIVAHGTRFVKIEGFSEPQDAARQRSIEVQWGAKMRNLKENVQPNSHALIRILEFNDIRDAIAAVSELRQVHGSLDVEHISDTEFANFDKASVDAFDHVNARKFDGQVMFVVTFQGHSVDPIERSEIDKKVYEIAAGFGHVRAFKEVTPYNSGSWQFKAEYWNITAAEAAIHHMSRGPGPIRKGDWVISIKQIVDVPSNATRYPRVGNGVVVIQKSVTGRTSWVVNEHGVAIPQQPAVHVPKLNTNPGDAGPIIDDLPYRGRINSDPAAGTPSGYELMLVAPRSNSFAGPPTFHAKSRDHKHTREEELTRINPDNILNGTDVRTTIMIRNLPNLWDCHDMKRALDETIWGRYDFSYLRIDFATNTNVGYCFVNCIDVDGVLEIYRKWSGRPFGVTAKKEPKICSVSYASNQGVETLIDRFRNSAVMDEFADFRPMLWYTVDSAKYESGLIGTQRAFPQSNNQYKKQRSQDNASQIGLYAPRSKFQHGNRAHRSQYDRGTPSQLKEEALYNLVAGTVGCAPDNSVMPPHMAQQYTHGTGNNNFGTMTATLPRTLPNQVNINNGLGGFGGQPANFNATQAGPYGYYQSFGGAYGSHPHHDATRGVNGNAGHANHYNGNRGFHGSGVHNPPHYDGNGGQYVQEQYGQGHYGQGQYGQGQHGQGQHGQGQHGQGRGGRDAH